MIGNPFPLKQNVGKSFQGSIVLGKGFVLEPQEAQNLIAKDPRNREVLYPYLNGDDLNNDPEQKPSRWVINFFDWSEEKARTYPECFAILERLVKPERQRWKIDETGNETIGTYALRKPLPQKWWIYGEKRPALYKTISKLDQVMVSCRVSKFVNQSLVENNCVFDVTTSIVTRCSYFEYAFLQSTLHEQWAWKYASTLESRIRYLNVDCIDTFPIPENSPDKVKQLGEMGKQYHFHRRHLMSMAKIGLTRIYNLFHSSRLSLLSTDENIDDKSFEQKYGREASGLRRHAAKMNSIETYNAVVEGILKLRMIHVQLDSYILDAYGWGDIELRHNFYEVSYLSENDNIRFTIDPVSSKEVLKRLLKLNHQLYELDNSKISVPGNVVKTVTKIRSDPTLF